MALSTGTFLYIGAHKVIRAEFQEIKSKRNVRMRGIIKGVASRYLKFLAVVLGIAVTSSVAFLPHADHGHGDDHGC